MYNRLLTKKYPVFMDVGVGCCLTQIDKCWKDMPHLIYARRTKRSKTIVIHFNYTTEYLKLKER
jgi:hypothetical protein